MSTTIRAGEKQMFTNYQRCTNWISVIHLYSWLKVLKAELFFLKLKLFRKKPRFPQKTIHAKINLATINLFNGVIRPAGSYLLKVNNRNTRTKLWNVFKVNNKDTKTT